MKLKTVKDAGKNISKTVTKKIISKQYKENPTILPTPNQPTPNPSHQQAQNEMQGHYDALLNIKKQRTNHAINMIEQYMALSGPPKKQLTTEQMDQMQQEYFHSKANMAVLNFCKEINTLIAQHEASTPEEVLTAAKALSNALTKSVTAGFEDYLRNQTDLSIVESNLLKNSQVLIEQYSPVIEEDPSFFASFLRVLNYLFGSCMATEFSTNTVFSDSKNYLDLKNNFFRPEAKESQTENVARSTAQNTY